MIKPFDQKTDSSYYCPCTLQKGHLRIQVKLPSKYAKLYNTVKFRVGEDWEEGWIVVDVGCETNSKTEGEILCCKDTLGVTNSTKKD